jgi:hypothetical protein
MPLLHNPIASKSIPAAEIARRSTASLDIYLCRRNHGLSALARDGAAGSDKSSFCNLLSQAFKAVLPEPGPQLDVEILVTRWDTAVHSLIQQFR